MTMGECLFMDRLLAQVGREFGRVRFLEIGVAEGATMAGVLEVCDRLAVEVSYEGVDGAVGRPKNMIENCKFIEGDSTQVFNQVGSDFNILFIDGSHAQNYVMLDFLNYSPKVVLNGYVLFHDTRDLPSWQGLHYQGTGDEKLFENNISVRLALKKLGLLAGRRSDFAFQEEVADSDIMGMMLFKKIALL
jgi:hypothetical protein